MHIGKLLHYNSLFNSFNQQLSWCNCSGIPWEGGTADRRNEAVSSTGRDHLLPERDLQSGRGSERMLLARAIISGFPIRYRISLP